MYEKNERVGISMKKEDDVLCLEKQLCFPLYACAKEVVRKYRKPLGELNLTYTQYVVMIALWQYGSMTEGELGKKVCLDSGTLAPLLKRIEKEGLIKRTRQETDERKLLITLTDKGVALKEKAKAVPAQMKCCLNLDDEEKKQLKYLLDKALRGIDEE